VIRRITQAYDAYLRGNALVENFDQLEKLEAARRRFEDALKSDPDYAPALAGLAWVEGQIYRNIDSNPSHLQRAEQFAQRALTIDPRLSETHLALGTVTAISTTMRVQRASSAPLPIWIRTMPRLGSSFLGTRVRTAAGSRGGREGCTGIPASATLALVAYYHLGRALFLQQRYAEAIAAFEHARELNPTSPYLDLGLGQVYLAQGDYDKAVAALSKNVRPTGINYFWLAAAFAARGDREKALATLQKHSTRDFTILPYSMPARTSLRCARIHPFSS
jgi:eukaryotic-like serine/threonine-protein kinase